MLYDKKFDSVAVRQFNIFVALTEGYDESGRTFTQGDVNEAFAEFCEARLEADQPYLSGLVRDAGMAYFGWKESSGEVQMMEEHNCVISIATHPEFHRDLSAEQIDETIAALCSFLGDRFGQTRIYCYESAGMLSIFQRPESVAPTEKHPQQ